MLPAPKEVYRRLLKAYGPQGWWPVTPRGGKRPAYRPGRWGPLSERERSEICVGAILAQNTNWGNVVKALEALHRSGTRDLRGIARMPQGRLERLIRPSGYFRQKARKLKVFARHALGIGKRLPEGPRPRRPQERSWRRGLGRWLSRPLPELREELLGLWGVGPETADSILLYAGGRPAFVIDAYTLRIGRRLGWFRKAGYARAQALLVRNLPASPELYGELHALLVALAKYHCRSRPVCPGCPLLEVCRHGRNAVASA